MFYRLSLSLLIAAAALETPASGEKVNMSPEALRKTATHVITGNVVNVYERTETVGDWKYTRYVAEIRVNDLEKGDRIDEGGLVYARYWGRSWVGKGRVPPSTSGHRGLPVKGAKLRVYLARNEYDGFSRDNNDGGFNVIGANGFEALPKDAAE